MVEESLTDKAERGRHHTWYEDVFAIFLGTSLVGIGIYMFSEARLLTGSTAGAALLIQYATGIGFPILFFVINLPFYVLAILRLGWNLAIRTVVCVSLVSFYTANLPIWMPLEHIEPLYAAMAGGAAIGLGILALFRHRASMGGVNILTLYLQERFALRAGYVSLGIDLVILAVGALFVPLDRLAYSVLGALVLNLVIALNHRPGRYLGFS